jgi:hypothetical protein
MVPAPLNWALLPPWLTSSQSYSSEWKFRLAFLQTCVIMEQMFCLIMPVALATAGQSHRMDHVYMEGGEGDV